MKKKSHLNSVSIVACSALLGPLHAGTPPPMKVIEAQRRMDPTGAGAFHRAGLLREQENTRRNLKRKQDDHQSAQNNRVTKS